MCVCVCVCVWAWKIPKSSCYAMEASKRIGHNHTSGHKRQTSCFLSPALYLSHSSAKLTVTNSWKRSIKKFNNFLHNNHYVPPPKTTGPTVKTTSTTILIYFQKGDRTKQMNIAWWCSVYLELAIFVLFDKIIPKKNLEKILLVLLGKIFARTGFGGSCDTFTC